MRQNDAVDFNIFVNDFRRFLPLVNLTPQSQLRETQNIVSNLVYTTRYSRHHFGSEAVNSKSEDQNVSEIRRRVSKGLFL